MVQLRDFVNGISAGQRLCIRVFRGCRNAVRHRDGQAHRRAQPGDCRVQMDGQGTFRSDTDDALPRLSGIPVQCRKGVRQVARDHHSPSPWAESLSPGPRRAGIPTGYVL